MTLRRTIAARLRLAAARELTASLNDETHALIVETVVGPTDDSRAHRASAARRLLVASLVGLVARWLDPDPHPATAGLDPNRERVEPAAPAGARVGGIEQAAMRAAADAQGGQEGQGSTPPLARVGMPSNGTRWTLNIPHVDARPHETGSAVPPRPYRVVKGGRAWHEASRSTGLPGSTVHYVRGRPVFT